MGIPRHLPALSWLTAALIATFSGGIPEAQAATRTAERPSQQSPSSAKKKIKVKQERSPAEETKAERDRRLYRECQGRPNSGACLGYTRR